MNLLLRNIYFLDQVEYWVNLFCSYIFYLLYLIIMINIIYLACLKTVWMSCWIFSIYDSSMRLICIAPMQYAVLLHATCVMSCVFAHHTTLLYYHNYFLFNIHPSHYMLIFNNFHWWAHDKSFYSIILIFLFQIAVTICVICFIQL